MFTITARSTTNQRTDLADKATLITEDDGQPPLGPCAAQRLGGSFRFDLAGARYRSEGQQGDETDSLSRTVRDRGDDRTKGVAMGLNRRRGERWVLLIVAAAALIGMTSCAGTGGGSELDDDPRAALSVGAEPLVAGGSARVKESLSFGPSGSTPLTADGVISWKGAGGSTGDLRLQGLMGAVPVRGLFTDDALYIETSGLFPSGTPSVLPGLAGKQWLKQSFAAYARSYGPIGQVLTAGISQTNPVRSAALLAQSPDLRNVGKEPINGVTATHYSGTIRFTEAVEDLRLGLDRKVLDQLRAEFSQNGLSDAQQYDLWVDDQGRPVRAQGRPTNPSEPGNYSVDYSDYGPSHPVQAPPADQVADVESVMPGLGGN